MEEFLDNLLSRKAGSRHFATNQFLNRLMFDSFMNRGFRLLFPIAVSRRFAPAKDIFALTSKNTVENGREVMFSLLVHYRSSSLILSLPIRVSTSIE